MDLLTYTGVTITSAFAILSTYYLVKVTKMSSVFISAGLSLIVALFFILFPNLLPEVLSIKIPIVFIGASFVGMSSTKILHGLGYLIFAGLVFTLVFINVSSIFKGFGGGLGTSAAISVICVLGLEFLIKQVNR